MRGLSLSKNEEMNQSKYLLPLVPILLTTAFASNRAIAQDQTLRIPKYFDIVVRFPTGKNGYEELVLASDVLYLIQDRNERFADFHATLTIKRDTLTLPAVQKAFDLLTIGLSKPISSPRSEVNENTTFPEFAGFRLLARLLACKMYVEMADGKVSMAINTLRQGLALGYAVQQDGLIAGLVGVAIDAISLKRFSIALDQMSVKDCTLLMNLAREWINLADPMIHIYESEREAELSILRNHRNNPHDLVNALTFPTANDETNAEQAALIQQLLSDPQAARNEVNRAIQISMNRFNELISELKKPHWQRKKIKPLEDKTVAGKLASAFTISSGSIISDKFVQDQALVQLLGVQAVIRKYRWENDKLPDSLATLKLGDLGIDPFTGKELIYKQIDDRNFELSSIGPDERDDEGHETGKRRQLMLKPN